MRTTAILNLKGGVAKTVTCVNMAAILAADYGKRVLVVDADSQANTTEFFGGDQSCAGLADALRGKCDSSDRPLRLQTTGVKNVELISADDTLMDLDLSAVKGGSVRVDCLKEVRVILEKEPPVESWLKPIYGEPIDYMLIDCPPAFNAACAAALLAADDVIIPIKLDAFSLRGMANLMRQIANMRKINPNLRVAGLLPTMVYKSEKISAALDALRASKLFVFPAIRKTNKVDDMTFAQKPLIESSPKSAACVDYRRFVTVYVRQGKGGAVNG